MAVKYHISPVTGKPEKCTATKKPCKYGGSEAHYSNVNDASEAAEMMNEELASADKYNNRLSKKKNNAPMVELRRDDASTRRTFISIMDSDGELLSQGSGNYLDGRLFPGDYAGYVRDKDAGVDRLVRLSVHDDGSMESVEYDGLSKTDYSSIDSGPTAGSRRLVRGVIEDVDHISQYLEDARAGASDDEDAYRLFASLNRIEDIRCQLDYGYNHDFASANQALGKLIDYRGECELDDGPVSDRVMRYINDSLPDYLRHSISD